MLDLISFAAIHSSFKSVCDDVLSSKDPYSRSTKQGHITASGLVIKDGKALLIFHPFIRQWFQPGGHIDAGEEPIQAAIREVFEETGVVCVSLNEFLHPIDIDLHEIPANPKKGEGSHLHIDLLFTLKAVGEGDSPEDIQKAWIPVDQIATPRIKRALKKLQSQI
ncbi:NUDIX hydrolase [Polynucleobacter sp. UK-Mo-2m-Kol15]|uniref:NUDIX hydrolase n=1 Tax=Polynucleobacter sp. UK-Mo-2m-Kol15 TaxID=2576916 RepID=UPI001C0DB907|nr:NUDIX domain-containing protein [Polynucleobacter sp. UK-Mo-2m-Kol15]MBU3575283.1 NUDIX domain-containing protein [Polynucleobacter sp. UK-Mo-2m-Kol15]